MTFAAGLWASLFSHSIDLLKLSLFFHSIDLLKFFYHSINGSRRNYVEMIRIMKGTLFIICSSFDVSEAPVRCSDNIQSAIKSLSGNQIVHSSYMCTVTQKKKFQYFQLLQASASVIKMLLLVCVHTQSRRAID